MAYNLVGNIHGRRVWAGESTDTKPTAAADDVNTGDWLYEKNASTGYTAKYEYSYDDWAKIAEPDSSGNPAVRTLTEGPEDYQGSPAQYATDDIGAAGSDYRYVDPMSARVVEIEFVDRGSSSVEELFVMFNPVGDTAAERAVTAEIQFQTSIGSTADTAMTATGFDVIQLGATKIFTFAEDAECTSIYMAGNSAETGANGIRVRYI